MIGFDVDLAHAFAARWLGDTASVALVPLPADEVERDLETGDVDMVIAPLLRTYSNSQRLDFSQTYLMGRQAMLIPSASTVETFQDLQHAPVGILTGSTNVERADCSSTAGRRQPGITGVRPG